MAKLLRITTWVVFSLLCPVAIYYTAPYWLPHHGAAELQQGAADWPSTFLPVSIFHVTLLWISALVSCRWPAAPQLAADSAAELVRLSGYLYTLLALVLVLQWCSSSKFKDPNELLGLMLPLMGAGLYTSLLGWFLAPFIELTPIASKSSAELGVMQTEMLRLLTENTSPSIARFNEILAEAAAQIAASTKNLPEVNRFLGQAAQLMASVQLLVETDAQRRDQLEQVMSDCQLKLAQLTEAFSSRV